MKGILIQIGIYLIKQEWFQMAVVKLITKASELAAVAAENSETTIDDALFDFLKRNKAQLLTIIKREIPLTDTPIDDMLLEAIRSIK